MHFQAYGSCSITKGTNESAQTAGLVLTDQGRKRTIYVELLIQVGLVRFEESARGTGLDAIAVFEGYEEPEEETRISNVWDG